MIKLRIELSKHAKQRMIEREIKFEYIQETIEFPDYTIKNNGKTEAYKSLGNKTLKVVYINEHNFINVVTVIWK
ncbi:MAG: DUF4258 domain-containing protein [Nanoarchaeota archaeon]